MARNLLILPTLALLLGVAGCAPDTYFPPTDFERAGTWQAEGVNDRNLRTMVADPSHLTRGVGAATDRGAAGAAAVRALEAGRRPALPQASLTSVGQDSGGGNTGVTSGGGGSSSGR